MNLNDPVSNELDELFKAVRKYRKKLRQIERLETSGRELTKDEQSKLLCKNGIRLKLQGILHEINRRDDSMNSTDLEWNITTEEDNTTVNDTDPGVQNENERSDAIYFEQQQSNTEVSNVPLADLDVHFQNDRNDTLYFEQHQSNTEVPNVPAADNSSDSVNAQPPASKQMKFDKESPNEPEKINSQTNSLAPKQPSPLEEKAEKAKKMKSKVRKTWRSKTLSVTMLEGHNDVVNCVQCQAGWLVTGSRDTSVKLWDIENMKEIRNMAGHTGSVTAVQILDETDSNRIRQSIELESNELFHDVREMEFERERLLLTSSLDCYVKLWLLPHGYCVKSLYAYSSVTAMLFVSSLVYIGTDNGKLIVYNIINGERIHEEMIHQDQITSLKWHLDGIVSSSFDGQLKYFHISPQEGEIENGIILKKAFSLSEENGLNVGRQILCSASWNHKLVYGDDGSNLKVVDPETGFITRHPNHKSSGFTNSILLHKDLMLSTCYELDTGESAVNVRSLKDDIPLLYLTTFTHTDLPRLTCASVDRSALCLSFATGGSKLLLWRDVGLKTTNLPSLEIKGKSHPDLNKVAQPSDEESCASETEDEGGWWWSKPVETGSTKKSEEQSESDSDSSIEELKTKTAQNSWNLCSVV